MKNGLFIAVMMLLGCTFPGQDFDLNASVDQVYKHLGPSTVIEGNRHYWCREGAHGAKQLLMARFENDKLVENIQNQYEFQGQCDALVRAWSAMFKRADEIGVTERW